MNIHRKLVTGVVVFLALSGVAHALETTLFTPPIEAIGTSHIQCEIVNVSGETRTVRVQALNGRGTVIFDSGAVPIHGGGVFVAGIGNVSAYCKFIVDGVPGTVRAAALGIPSGTGSVAVYPAQ